MTNFDKEHSRNNSTVHIGTDPQVGNLDPINESKMSSRKASLNLQTQKKAMALY